MSKETKKPFTAELLLVIAEVHPKEAGQAEVRFGTQTAEPILIQMCKEDPESWKLVKNIITDTINKIEAAAKEEE